MATKKQAPRKTQSIRAGKPTTPAKAAPVDKVDRAGPASQPARAAAKPALAAPTASGTSGRRGAVAAGDAGRVPSGPARPARSSKDTNEKGAKKDKGKSKEKAKAERKKDDGGHKKMVRDSFTMPFVDYALIESLKTQTLAIGVSAKKSELLRAGLIMLSRMPTTQLTELLSSMPTIKTGRPGKKKK